MATSSESGWVAVEDSDIDVIESAVDDTVFTGEEDFFEAAGIEFGFYRDDDWDPEAAGVTYRVDPDRSYDEAATVQEALADFAGIITESPHVQDGFAREVIGDVARQVWEDEAYSEAVERVSQRHTYPGTSFGTTRGYGVEDFVDDVMGAAGS